MSCVTVNMYVTVKQPVDSRIDRKPWERTLEAPSDPGAAGRCQIPEEGGDYIKRKTVL